MDSQGVGNVMPSVDVEKEPEDARCRLSKAWLVLSSQARRMCKGRMGCKEDRGVIARHR